MRLKRITGILTGHCLLLSSGRMYYEDATDLDLGEETPLHLLRVLRECDAVMAKGPGIRVSISSERNESKI